MTGVVRLGDWRDVLPGTYDPATAVVVTDPPFGLAGKGASNGGDRHRVDRGFVDDRPWIEHVRAMLADLPAHRYVIRGSSPAVISVDPPPRRLCVEVAPTFRSTIYRPGVVDYAWTGWAVYGSLRIDRRRRMPRDAVVLTPETWERGTRVPRVRHRGMTPTMSARWAVDAWCPPGWTVLDPFAGTGTIGRVALELGREYLGAEILETWQREAQRAIGSTPLRLDLGA